MADTKTSKKICAFDALKQLKSVRFVPDFSHVFLNRQIVSPDQRASEKNMFFITQLTANTTHAFWSSSTLNSSLCFELPLITMKFIHLYTILFAELHHDGLIFFLSYWLIELYHPSAWAHGYLVGKNHCVTHSTSELKHSDVSQTINKQLIGPPCLMWYLFPRIVMHALV